MIAEWTFLLAPFHAIPLLICAHLAMGRWSRSIFANNFNGWRHKNAVRKFGIGCAERQDGGCRLQQACVGRALVRFPL